MLEYGWLLLPPVFAFLVFPLAGIVLSGVSFVWVAALLLQRAKGRGYVRAILTIAVMMVLWLGICALLTFLADDLFKWAGEAISPEGHMVTTVLIGSFAVYGLTAAAAAKLLRIASLPDAAALFAGVMMIAAGAVINGRVDSLWPLPVGVAAASVLMFFYLRYAVKKPASPA